MSMHRHAMPAMPYYAIDGTPGKSGAALSFEQRAAVHYSRGEKEKALDLYREAARLAPGDVAVQKAFADFTYVALGRSDDALPLYQHVLDLNPNDTDTLQIVGNLCASRQKSMEARQYFTRLLELEPWNMAARKSMEALPAVAEAPDSFKAVILSAQESFHSGEDDRVNAAIDRIVQMKHHASKISEGVQHEPSYSQIQDMASRGQHEQAIAALERLISRTPDNALAHNDLGVLYANAGNLEGALRHYRSAVKLDPTTVTYQKNLADLLFVGEEDPEAALQSYVAILRAAPRDIETLGAIAQVCTSLGRTEDARFFYDKILEIEPWNQMARAQRGGLASAAPKRATYEEAKKLADEGKILEARDTMEAFVRSTPGHAAAHNDLGVLDYQTGHVEEAIREYEEAVRLDPENMIFQKNLAEHYSVALGRNEDALRIFVDILRKNPRDAETLVSIGRVCDMLGRADDAQDFFKKALEVEPWNQHAREQLQRI